MIGSHDEPALGIDRDDSPPLQGKEQVAADLGTTEEEDSGLSRQGVQIPGVRLDESERPSFEISLRQKEIGEIQRGTPR